MAPRAVAYAVDDLRRAGIIGGTKEFTTAEDAARALVAVVGDFGVVAPHVSVERFWDLPLNDIDVVTEEADAIVWRTLDADDDRDRSIRRVYGETFGEVLTAVIEDLVSLPGSAKKPGNIRLTSAQGATHADLWIDLDVNVVVLRFGYRGGPMPFGLAPAIPLRTVEIPAAIFSAISRAIKGVPRGLVGAVEDRPDCEVM